MDVGEDTTVPDDFTQIEIATGMWWRHLVSGGIAGSVSRTFTAPLDRIKVFLQVNTVLHMYRKKLNYVLFQFLISQLKNII